MRTTRAERKAAIEAKRVAALGEFHRLHRCWQCGAAADVIVISAQRAAGSLHGTRAVTRNYCHGHAPRML